MMTRYLHRSDPRGRRPGCFSARAALLDELGPWLTVLGEEAADAGNGDPAGGRATTDSVFAPSGPALA